MTKGRETPTVVIHGRSYSPGPDGRWYDEGGSFTHWQVESHLSREAPRTVKQIIADLALILPYVERDAWPNTYDDVLRPALARLETDVMTPVRDTTQ